MAKKTLNEQAKEILKIAEESGVQGNFFFITTFKRYQVQLNMLNDIEKALKEAKIKYYMNGEENGRKNTIRKFSNTSYERRRKNKNK